MTTAEGTSSVLAGADDVGASDDLARRTLQGLQWTYGAIACSAVMQVAYTAVMGRLLAPRAYGLVASAQVILKFGQLLSEMGLGPAIVQRPQLDRTEIRAAFTSIMLLGGSLAAAIALAAPLTSLLYTDPAVVPVTRALALTLLLNACGLTSVALLRRRLRFRALAALEVASFAVGYLGVGLVSALLGAGVWSLVAAALTQVGIQAVGAYLLTRHPVAPTLAWKRLRPFYSFGARVSLLTALENGAFLGTTVVIGRQSGLAALGQYNRASLLIDLPLGHLVTGLIKVVFPAMSRIQHDRQRVARAYLGALRVSGSLILPVAAGVAVAAPELVAVLLGPQWGTAAALLPPLALGSVLAVLSTFGAVVCEALAELNRKIVLQSLTLALVVAGLFAVPRGALMGYALVVAAGELLRHLAYVVLLRRVLDLPVRTQLAAYRAPLLAGAGVAAATGAWSLLARASQWGLAPTFLGQLTVAAGALAVLLWYGPLRDVRDEIVARLQPEGPPSPPLRRVLAVLTVGQPGRDAILHGGDRDG